MTRANSAARRSAADSEGGFWKIQGHVSLLKAWDNDA
jgi:hypothetical protein